METEQPEATKSELTVFLLLLSFVSCLGSFQFGFTMWLVHDPTTIRTFFYNISTHTVMISPWGSSVYPVVLALTISSFLLGCVCGALLTGHFADNFGRKGALLINDVLTLISTIVFAISKSVDSQAYFILARFFSGICIGIFSTAVPMYLGEISPITIRGRIGMMPALFVTTGILLSQVLCRPEILGHRKGWAFVIGCSGIIALFQLFLLLPFPESPRYLLIQQGDEAAARQALQNLRNQLDVHDEVEDLHLEALYEKREKGMTTRKILRSTRQRWQVVCAVALIAVQQSCGINAAYFYTEKIIGSIKINKLFDLIISVFLTVFLLLAHGISIFLIDTKGRKHLLLCGIGICLVSCLLLTLTLQIQPIAAWMSYVSAAILIIFLFGHNMGPGSIPQLMVAELFLQSSRSSAYAVAGMVQWFLDFFNGFLFIWLENRIGSYSFILFFPIGVIGYFYILTFVPETKNISFLDIRKHLEIFLAKRSMDETQATKRSHAA